MASKVNIVTFPHSISQIQDQIDFLTSSLKQSGVMYQISNAISTIYPNILIEGFSKFFALEVIKFCKKHRAKVVFVLTEHLEIVDGSLLINEKNIDSFNEYMPDAAARFQAFFSLLPYIRFFVLLGHLPLKEKLSQVFKSMPIIELPYTNISPPKVDIVKGVSKTIDFVHQGALTSHRLSVLKKVKKISSSVSVAFDGSSQERLLTLQKSRYALQIPQYKKWRYLSTMRGLYCLRHGIPMINISDHVIHEFDSIFPRVSPSKLQVELDKYLLLSPEKCYLETLERYNSYVAQQAKSKLSGMIQLWADLDGISQHSE